MRQAVPPNPLVKWLVLHVSRARRSPCGPTACGKLGQMRALIYSPAGVMSTVQVIKSDPCPKSHSWSAVSDGSGPLELQEERGQAEGTGGGRGGGTDVLGALGSSEMESQ